MMVFKPQLKVHRVESDGTRTRMTIPPKIESDDPSFAAVEAWLRELERVKKPASRYEKRNGLSIEVMLTLRRAVYCIEGTLRSERVA